MSIVQKGLDKFLKHDLSWPETTRAYHAGVRHCAQLVYEGVPISVILSDIGDGPLYSVGDKVYLKYADAVVEIVAKNASSRFWVVKDKDNFGTVVHDTSFCHLRKWAEE